MNINNLDLNLLRLFDAIYARKKVSLAADQLGISQPAASQGLARLRVLLEDQLFVRAPGGVRPTPRGERLAVSIRHALDILEQGLAGADIFDPAHSQRVFRIHMMSDMGEDRFLPKLLAAMEKQAPRVRLETVTLPMLELVPAMDKGQVDFAFGSLPRLMGSRHMPLFDDQYVIMLGRHHPFLSGLKSSNVSAAKLHSLEFVGAQTHADTLRMLKLMGLEGRLRLVTEHFLVLPAIIHATHLCAVVPRSTAREFCKYRDFAILEPHDLPLRDFTISLYWGRRFDEDPAVVWFRELARQLFEQPPHAGKLKSRRAKSA